MTAENFAVAMAIFRKGALFYAAKAGITAESAPETVLLFNRAYTAGHINQACNWVQLFAMQTRENPAELFANPTKVKLFATALLGLKMSLEYAKECNYRDEKAEALLEHFKPFMDQMDAL